MNKNSKLQQYEMLLIYEDATAVFSTIHAYNVISAVIMTLHASDRPTEDIRTIEVLSKKEPDHSIEIRRES